MSKRKNSLEQKLQGQKPSYCCDDGIKPTRYIVPPRFELGLLDSKSRVLAVPPRFELGLLDSKSRVLAVTPWNRQSLLFSVTLRRDLKILKYCNLLHCRKL
ncbi:hypothetical protein T03_9982 [Trichinella britovi]|uniref:Uncharacterized protein n=1 Tax=Trichinella britovi TaxID=45882 RepID=A0A0V1DIC9_TRIBR|nr:hypothetical protein T03_9982 [Trichinella britovi]